MWTALFVHFPILHKLYRILIGYIFNEGYVRDNFNELIKFNGGFY